MLMKAHGVLIHDTKFLLALDITQAKKYNKNTELQISFKKERSIKSEKYQMLSTK